MTCGFAVQLFTPRSYGSASTQPATVIMVVQQLLLMYITDQLLVIWREAEPAGMFGDVKTKCQYIVSYCEESRLCELEILLMFYFFSLFVF